MWEGEDFCASSLGTRPSSKEAGLPYINVQVTKGVSRSQKARLVREMTDTVINVLGKRPEHIHIVIQEIAEEDWGFSGLLTDDWKKQQES